MNTEVRTQSELADLLKRGVVAIALAALIAAPAYGQISEHDQERVVRCFTKYRVGKTESCNGDVWYGCDGGAVLDSDFRQKGPMKAWSYESRRMAFFYGTITDPKALSAIRSSIRKHIKDGTMLSGGHDYEAGKCPIG